MAPQRSGIAPKIATMYSTPNHHMPAQQNPFNQGSSHFYRIAVMQFDNASRDISGIVWLYHTWHYLTASLVIWLVRIICQAASLAASSSLLSHLADTVSQAALLQSIIVTNLFLNCIDAQHHSLSAMEMCRESFS